MRLHAYSPPLPSNGKVSIGSWLFSVDSQGILTPQPTPQQLAAGIGVFLKYVEVKATPAPLQEDFKVNTPTPSSLDPLEALFGKAIEPDEDAPPSAPVAKNPPKDALEPEVAVEEAPTYVSMSLSELKIFAAGMGVGFPANITKTKLIELLSQE